MAEEDFDEQDTNEIPEDLNTLEIDEMPEELRSPETHEHGEKFEVEERKWPGWPGENVFRLLIPANKVGGIIGRKGDIIKKICEETKARIKILDCPSGTMERAVLISAKEEPNLPLSPAMEGLLAVHARIVDLESDQPQILPGKLSTRLLVAAMQAGSLIGKQGGTIKSIQDGSDCIIRVLGGDNLPPFALSDDSVVEIQGDPQNVHKAIELIITHLRKFLVDRSIVQVFEMQMQLPNAGASQNVPPPWRMSPQDYPMNADSRHGYIPSHQPYRPPPNQYDNYYPPADMPPTDNRQGPPSYGRDGPLGLSTPSTQPQQSVVAKVAQTMQIPLSYADAVIGNSGATISYIRRASGATIAIQETKGVPGEMTVEINGSTSQVQAAQQLIHNVIAEVAAAEPQNPAGAPTGQGYNGYPNYDHNYGPSSNAGHPPPAEYGSVYGTDYGY
ncbi:flowering locus K homology domain-like [Impatiens glandulifera]|uniref:flowering locus K homology domain-like n=1 Tax=Impatiens glandulifera TaxID=253017 RepID=UPI001FB0B874|nr:flowering locus K homology domain-like [Impatiens glandulifera]XP_047316049.1 flowering locus K homology domain-like [Impatiens glandulifera]